MDYLTLSVAYTGLKAVSAVVSNFQKLKKLSDLPTEIQEDTFYLIHTVESIKPALELAILLHSRQLTAIHVSSAISLARKVLVECDTFIESISFINDDNETDDNSDNDSTDSNSNTNCDYNSDNNNIKNRQEIIEYLSAPSQRDRLALLLRRLTLVLQALNLGITCATFIFPKQQTIYQFPFKFEYKSFQIALHLIRKMEMNRKFNTNNKREIWVLTGNLHLFIMPSSKFKPILKRLYHAKCVLNLEGKKRKLDGKNVFAAFMTVYDIEKGNYINDSDENEEKNDNSDGINKKCYRMELDFLDFEKFRRYDPIYTKDMCEYNYNEENEDDIRNNVLCYQWIYEKKRFILEFEPLDKFNLKNIEQPISCEVFEFLISLLIIRSTYLESNSKTKNVIDNPSILDQFVSTKDMIKMSRKYLRFMAMDKDNMVTLNQKILTQIQSGNNDMDDLVESLSNKLSVK
eukprot:322742_1